MLADFDTYYRALTSRDARFDGRFFTGVTTTGIYCRPICPARTPKPQNVRFFACAAAAEEAGFRPCRRCRPDAAPGTPAWLGTSATVSRALRLIAEGALDGEGIDRLAARLGVGQRHLRRLFAEHLGTSPGAIASTRRTHFARKLIDETRLPMTAIALDAGFSSVRRFNAAIRATFGRSPTELRRTARSHLEPSSPGELLLKLPYRPPLDWELLAAFLAARAIPGVEMFDGDAYRRTIQVADATGVIEIRPVEQRAHLLLSVRLGGSSGLLQVVEGVRRMFDLGADPLEINRRLANDPRLASLIAAHPGLRVPGTWDPFELSVRAVLGQQVSVKGATTLAGRLVREFGTLLANPSAAGVTHLFPTPAALARADVARIGLPSARAEAVRLLARAVCDGRLRFDATCDSQQVQDELTAIAGIGPWTAQYVAMRALQEPDAFLPGDLGLRRALSDNGKPQPAATLLSLAERWRPWRAYAVMHLWMSDNSSDNSHEQGRSKHATHAIAPRVAARNGRHGVRRARSVRLGV